MDFVIPSTQIVPGKIRKLLESCPLRTVMSGYAPEQIIKNDDLDCIQSTP